jgi:hypothetical protein
MTTVHTQTLLASIKAVLIAQGVIALILFIIAAIWFTWVDGVAGIWGAVLGMIGTVLTGRSVKRSSDAVALNEKVALAPAFSGTFAKLLFVGAGVVLGIVQFGLDPFFTVAGLALAQFAYPFAVFASVNDAS